MRKAYKYRIYPNKLQREYFAKVFGCVRFFYNKSLSDMNELYKSKRIFKNITPASYKEDYPFLKEVDSLALCNAQTNRNMAFKSFFKKLKAFPKYKSKRNEQSYTTNNQGSVKFSTNDRYISIPKCSRIRIKKHRDFYGVIKSITVSKTTDGKYYISLLVEEEETKSINLMDNVIGLDLGIKDLIVDSNGNKYRNPKYLSKSLKKLAKEQRKLSHMEKGSNNRNKQRIKVARIHRYINNQRNDYLHKLSKKIIDENQIICIEDLKVKNMEQDHKLARSIVDASWSRFVSMLIYKASWYGNKIIKVPTNYASSQLCSLCGYQNKEVKNLKIRKWTCPECGSVHDRDTNAAKNILSKGIEMLTKDGTHPDSLFMLGSLEPSSKKPPLF
ncbi:MAG: IS200/IS605 family element RNA-guided endonuclease TnpB [Bacilli bacterium]|nr:IS200/IS605 family element RNA-guided endonuclease TnpB [Bacilli bacterium]MDY6362739.1 IS200/IS605 family element RNA-guided endonuclease TnpB [Bacilli bacterium]